MSNDQAVLKKAMPFNIAFILAYISLFVVSFIRETGTFCTETQVYRKFTHSSITSYIAVVYLGLYVLHMLYSIVIFTFYKKK